MGKFLNLPIYVGIEGNVVRYRKSSTVVPSLNWVQNKEEVENLYVKVDATETRTAPAGSLDTYRIKWENYVNGQSIENQWYSEVVKNYAEINSAHFYGFDPSNPKLKSYYAG